MQHRWLGRATLFLCLLVPWPATAGPIYWQLDGEITYNPPYGPYADLNPILPVGTDVTFLITVDPMATDQCDNPGAGLYFLPGATMVFDGNSHAGSAFMEVNNPEGNCVDFGTIGTFVRASFDGVPGLTTIIVGFPPGDALPTTPGAFNFWIGNHDPNFSCCEEDSPPLNVFGEIDRSAVVPEPSTLLLFAGGLAAIAARRRRRSGLRI